MHNDSIESLLLRHYGSTAQVPAELEGRLCASVRAEVRELRKQEKSIAYWQQGRVSRRKAVKLVAMGATGLSVLCIGMESLQAIGSALMGEDVTQPAYP
jgi:hypothetical protein